MHFFKIIFSGLFLLGLFSCQEEKPKTPLAKSVHYLWSQQGEDGGWHSPVHGIMKAGQAHTPFVLFALLGVPDSIYQPSPDQVQKGLDFLRKHISEEGAMGFQYSYALEYPNYATAYALRVLVKYGQSEDSILIKGMTQYLLDQQYTEQRGIFPDHPAYGSWGFGEKGIPEGATGHIDISHTRKVLQAIREAGVVDSSVYAKARKFLAMVQKHPSDNRPQPEPGNLHPIRPENGYKYDGGFYSSPIIIERIRQNMIPKKEFSLLMLRLRPMVFWRC